LLGILESYVEALGRCCGWWFCKAGYEDFVLMEKEIWAQIENLGIYMELLSRRRKTLNWIEIDK